MSDENTKPAEDEPEAAGPEPGEDTENSDPEVVLHGEDDDAAGCFSNVCAGNHPA
jgi:hypothetical protein